MTYLHPTGLDGQKAQSLLNACTAQHHTRRQQKAGCLDVRQKHFDSQDLHVKHAEACSRPTCTSTDWMYSDSPSLPPHSYVSTTPFHT